MKLRAKGITLDLPVGVGQERLLKILRALDVPEDDVMKEARSLLRKCVPVDVHPALFGYELHALNMLDHLRIPLDESHTWYDWAGLLMIGMDWLRLPQAVRLYTGLAHGWGLLYRVRNTLPTLAMSLWAYCNLPSLSDPRCPEGDFSSGEFIDDHSNFIGALELEGSARRFAAAGFLASPDMPPSVTVHVNVKGLGEQLWEEDDDALETLIQFVEGKGVKGEIDRRTQLLRSPPDVLEF